MTKILIRGTNVQSSVGVQAMTICTMNIVNKSVKNAEFVIVSNNSHMYHRLYDKYGFDLTIIPRGRSSSPTRLLKAFTWSIFNNFFNVNMKVLLNDNILKAISEADLIIDMLGDGFSFDISNVGGTISANYSPIVHDLNILMATSLGKDVMLFPQSIGPFKNKFVRFLTKISLNTTKAVVVRENISKKCIEDLGVDKSLIYLTADAAFILDPEPLEYTKNLLKTVGFSESDFNKPIIGLNISQLLNYRSKNIETAKENYITSMGKLADYLTEKYNAKVILIPHSIFLNETINDPGKESENDIDAVKEAYEKVKHKKEIVPLVDAYSSTELKGIIGMCNIFIGARMHSNIAAISQCIPTIALSYSIKAPGIMSMVGLEKYVCDFKTMEFDEFKLIVDDLWTNRDNIRNEMVPKITKLKESVWYNGKLVNNILSRRNFNS